MRSRVGGGGAKRKIYAALTSGVADFCSSLLSAARAQESCKCKLDVDQDTAFLPPFRLAFPDRPPLPNPKARVHIPSTPRNYKPRARHASLSAESKIAQGATSVTVNYPRCSSFPAFE